MRRWLLFALTAALAAIFCRPLEAQSDAARRHANRGVAFLEQFRFGEAAREFEEVVGLAPNFAAGWINLGIAYFNERDFDRAAATFERALDLAPESPYVHYNLGLIKKLQGQTEQAVGFFERVAEIDPLDSMTQYNLGTLYANLGRLDDAEAALRRTIELQPNNESAHFSLGNVLIRQGRRDEGRQELERFRALKESFPAESASAGLQYTELGKYAEAVETSSEPLQPSAPEPTRAGDVRYVEATAAAGLELAALDAPEALPATISARDYNLSFVRDRVLPPLGTGLSLHDLDGDGDADLLFVRGGAPLVFFNEGGHFERAEDDGLPDSGTFVGVVVGDVDNDSDGDVYLTGSGHNALFLNDGSGAFTESPDETLRGDDVSVSAAFADVDHDGDLDLYVSNFVSPTLPTEEGTLSLPQDLPGAPNRLYRNNGNGSFTEIGRESRTDGGARRSLGALFADLDDDRDIDFVVVNDGSPDFVFSNDRVGSFTESSREWGIETGLRTRGVDSGDYDRDGSLDLIFSADGSMLNLLLRGPAREGFRPDVVSPRLLAAGVPGPRYGTAFLDGDNDMDLDLLLVANGEDALAVYYENTGAGFQRADALLATVAGQGHALSLADVDLDGDVDAVVATDRGELVYFRNDGGNRRNWLRVRARGLRSNLDGLGTKVEVRSGDASLRREIRSTNGYFSQSERVLHFGLGDADKADYVRFLWPGGVKQIEMDVPDNRTASIEELNRKGTSCPVLYAWDGEKIRFVTDFLGGSAFGYLLAPGQFNYPDTDEMVKMESFPLAARNGRYELRWVNQLEEVLIYDKASLVVVDHSDDVEVFPNERLMPGPPYPERKLYAVRDARPVRAIDDDGRDVTELVRAKDRRYPEDFALLPFKGYAETHALTLDLGELRPNESYVLLLYGWVDYADSSSNLAAAQAGDKLVTPFLEVGGADGEFELALDPMGFPAGLPKTMLVDLSGIVSPERHRVRITTSMRLYWDQIRVATIAPDATLRVQELAPAEAELSFLGYPAPFNPDGRSPSLYTYDRILPTELWGTHEGYYTRYGDVKPLVDTVDDRYVITHHGDELRLTFDESALAPLRPGLSRTFLAFADGFGKDMDLNSARPDTVAPLPFHGMTAYPYPEGETYPISAIQDRYTTRYVGPEGLLPFGWSAASNSSASQ
jgi:tetratricopeptide (TPR) repeat protein